MRDKSSQQVVCICAIRRVVRTLLSGMFALSTAAAVAAFAMKFRDRVRLQRKIQKLRKERMRVRTWNQTDPHLWALYVITTSRIGFRCVGNVVRSQLSNPHRLVDPTQSVSRSVMRDGLVCCHQSRHCNRMGRFPSRDRSGFSIMSWGPPTEPTIFPRLNVRLAKRWTIGARFSPSFSVPSSGSQLRCAFFSLVATNAGRAEEKPIFKFHIEIVGSSLCSHIMLRLNAPRDASWFCKREQLFST